MVDAFLSRGAASVRPAGGSAVAVGTLDPWGLAPLCHPVIPDRWPSQEPSPRSWSSAH